jgi:hypothetical protein
MLHEMLPASLFDSYWLDMTDCTLVMVMVNGVGAHLTNDEKRAHLIDLKRDHLIDHVCVCRRFYRRKDKFVSFRADRMTITNGLGISSRPKGGSPGAVLGPPGGWEYLPAKRGITLRGAGGLLPSLEVGGPGVDSLHHSAVNRG